ncbi:hypothetical protein M2302_004295 [Micromonospora sp. A200]|nr:hypothetical protein [Micromonospora sp. A200]
MQVEQPWPQATDHRSPRDQRGDPLHVATGTSRARRASRIRTAVVSQVGEASSGAASSKDTYLQARYQRIASRRGKKPAVVAVGHGILTAIWHMISNDAVRRRHGLLERQLGLLEFFVGIVPHSHIIQEGLP